MTRTFALFHWRELSGLKQTKRKRKTLAAAMPSRRAAGYCAHSL